MGQIFVLNGVDLGTAAIRLGQIPGWITRAELGAAGMCSFPMDDLSGSFSITGWRPFYVNEEDAPIGNQRVFTGYVADRTYTRGNGTSLILAGNRRITTNLTDQNAVLSMRLFPPTDSAANRSSETDLARVAWLLSTAYTGGSVSDYGLVSSSGAITMDATDYRGQSAMSLLNDCASASGKNFFVKYNETHNALELFYDFDYTAVYDATVSFSNVLADVQADVANSYYNLVLASAPISYWRLGEATPGTGTAVDAMGANNGTYVGSPTGGVTGALTGDPNTAVTLNGTTQWVTGGAGTGIPIGAASRSFGCWVKLSAQTCELVTWGDGAAPGWCLLYVNGAGAIVLFDGATSYTIGANGAVPTGAWCYIVVTYDGTTWTAYVNGIASSPTRPKVVNTSRSNNLVIGGGAAGVAYLNGSLDEVAIWNRALSAGEIAALYAAAPVRTAQGASSCFDLGDDWQLNVDPSLVYSGAQVPFSGTGSPVYVTRSATAGAFIARDTTAPNVNTKSSATATASGKRYLASIATEDQKITGTVRLPAAHVNDVLAGQRVQVKCTYMAEVGMDSAFVYLRVLSREVKQDELSDQFYNVYYELTPPVGPSVVYCSDSGYFPSAGFYPSLGHIDSPSGSNVTSTALGETYYFSPGHVEPGYAPASSYLGTWSFPNFAVADGSSPNGYSDGGVNNINTLGIFVSGGGTLTIHTTTPIGGATVQADVSHIPGSFWKANTIYPPGSYVQPTLAHYNGACGITTLGGRSGSTEPTWGGTVYDGTIRWDDGGGGTGDFSSTGSVGTFVVSIPPAADGACIHLIKVSGQTGNFNYAGFSWEPS